MAEEKVEIDPCDPVVFQQALDKYDELYVQVRSDHCAPCKALGEMVKQAAIPIPIVEIPESCDRLLDYLNIKSYPTVIKMKRGHEVSRHVGDPVATVEKMKSRE